MSKLQIDSANQQLIPASENFQSFSEFDIEWTGLLQEAWIDGGNAIESTRQLACRGLKPGDVF